MTAATEGFGTALRARMSPDLQRKIAQQQHDEAREAAVESRRREAESAQWQERNLQAAAQQAVNAGEAMTPRLMNGEGLGRSPAEFVRQQYALMDIEDAQERARQAVAFRRWQAAQTANTTADMTAPTQLEVEHATRAEEQRQDEIRRGREVHHRRREIRGMIRADHSLRRQGLGGV